MNILFSSVSTEAISDVARLLIERYEPDNYYITYLEGIPPIKASTGEGHCFPFRKNVHADYSGHIFYKECPPLDDYLLSSMAEHEPLILKMLDNHDEQAPSSLDERKRLYHRHLRYWNYMLDAAKIDAAFFAIVPHGTWNYIVYCLCKKKGIATAIACVSPIEPYWCFSDNIQTQGNEVSALYEKYTDFYRDKSIDSIDLPPDFQHVFYIQSGMDMDKKKPNYMKPPSRVKVIKGRILLVCNKLRKNPLLSFKTILNLFHQYFFIRGNQFLRIYDKLSEPADLSKPYIYLPLHYQPEMTSCPLGGIFVHQLLIAQMISFYLPEGVSIYVKEHPMQYSRCRSAQFYNDLAETPNVKLVHRSTDTYKLLKNCIAVASCTGTAGFEGLFMGKPFLIFGYFVNMYAPGAFPIRNREDCKEALDYILKHGANHTLKDLKIFLKALSEIVSPGLDFSARGGKLPPEKAACIADGMARVIDAQLPKN